MAGRFSKVFHRASKAEQVAAQQQVEREKTEVRERRGIREAIADALGPLARFDKVQSPSTQMAVALNRKGGPQYAGTVSKAVVAKRRAANKRARIARRAHR